MQFFSVEPNLLPMRSFDQGSRVLRVKLIVKLGDVCRRIKGQTRSVVLCTEDVQTSVPVCSLTAASVDWLYLCAAIFNQ